MDSNRKLVKFNWRRTSITSPTQLQERDTCSTTPSRWNMSPDEDSSTLPVSDSPGPDGLGAMSLDTPKRKAEVLSDSTPSVGKVKLRKLARKNLETFITSEVNLDCTSCSVCDNSNNDNDNNKTLYSTLKRWMQVIGTLKT